MFRLCGVLLRVRLVFCDFSIEAFPLGSLCTRPVCFGVLLFCFKLLLLIYTYLSLTIKLEKKKKYIMLRLYYSHDRVIKILNCTQ